jgi:hypothetical protein
MFDFLSVHKVLLFVCFLSKDAINKCENINTAKYKSNTEINSFNIVLILFYYCFRDFGAIHTIY